jgi:putative transposase
MIKTLKYRLKDRSAKRVLRQHAKAANAVWNWACAQQRDTEARYRLGAKPRKWASHYDLTKASGGVGAELGIHQQTVQEICRKFTQARDRLKHAPRFRSSFGIKRALGWVPFQAQSRQIEDNSVTYLGKRFRFFGSKRRPLPDTAKGGAFVEDALGRWWVCFVVEIANDNTPTAGEIGIDLGLKSLATTSDGEVIENLRHTAKWAAKLATAQRAGNKHRTRAVHAKIAACRRDHHHKVSTRLAREHAFIAVGDVNSKRLAKTGMGKSVLDAGWSSFRAMLAYKTAQYAEVDERFTTQTCSGCGSIAGPKGYAGLNERVWRCSECGINHDRDVNAARNILSRARSVAGPVQESREIAA